MKKFFLILLTLGAAAVALDSCKLEGSYEHTPTLTLTTIYKNPKDSLLGDVVGLVRDAENGYYVSDTVLISDSLHMAISGYSYANNLVSMTCVYDTTALLYGELANENVDKILVEPSDKKHGMHYFQSGYNGAGFEFGFRPLKAGAHKVTFGVTSDGKFSSSSLEVVLVVK